MRTVGFPIPGKEQELHRALVPADLPLVRDPSALVFERGYGAPLGLDDAAFEAQGARVAERAEVDACPVICDPKPIVSESYFGPGKTLFGWIHAVQGRAMTDLLVGHGMTGIAWEDMFEGERHSFWRNNELAGEAAVAHAFLQWGHVPYNCEVAVIGTGNVAMGAIRAAERGGCTVKVYDALTSHRIRGEIERYDVIVNAVLWDVTCTDHLVNEEVLERLRPGSLIVDVSCDEAGAIETSRPTTVSDPIYIHKGIVHYAVDHTPSLYYRTATESISGVVARFVSDLAEGRPNAVLEKATVIRDGRILDERITRFQSR